MMRSRALVLAVVASGLLPLAARAEHCSEIRLLSGRGLLVHTGAVGCAAGDVDTDFINPGSTTLLIRVFGADRPAESSSITFAPILESARCEPGRCSLTTWTRGEDAAGEPPGPYWDSHDITIEYRPGSVTGGEASIEICFGDGEDTHCESRTYRTVA